MANPSGYDIIFSSDCTGGPNLDHQIVSYNPVTGAIAMWVLLPNVSHTVDTAFYLSYGNTSVTASQGNAAPVEAARNAAAQSVSISSATSGATTQACRKDTVQRSDTPPTAAPPALRLGRSTAHP